jgi:hypothetical protein
LLEIEPILSISIGRRDNEIMKREENNRERREEV